MKYISSFVLLTLISITCQKNTEKTSISDNELLRLYIEAVYIYTQSDSLDRKARIDSLLNMHQVTFEEMQKKINEHNQSANFWIAFLDSVTQDLKKTTNKKGNIDIDK